MTRRDRQLRKLAVFAAVGMALSLTAFVAGIAFELGRWIARMDTDNALAPVEDWF